MNTMRSRRVDTDRIIRGLHTEWSRNAVFRDALAAAGQASEGGPLNCWGAVSNVLAHRIGGWSSIGSSMPASRAANMARHSSSIKTVPYVARCL